MSLENIICVMPRGRLSDVWKIDICPLLDQVILSAVTNCLFLPEFRLEICADR
jgi:hypothetical protein